MATTRFCLILVILAILISSIYIIFDVGTIQIKSVAVNEHEATIEDNKLNPITELNELRNSTKYSFHNLPNVAIPTNTSVSPTSSPNTHLLSTHDYAHDHLVHLRTIDASNICYEWEYFRQNKQSLKHSFNTTIPPNEWCEIDSLDVKCNDLYHVEDEHFYTNSFIICEIQSFTRHRDRCSKGGGTFILTLATNENASSYMNNIEGTVVDLFDGRYLGFVHTPYINRYYNHALLQYNLSIRLDFTAFRGSFSCKIKKWLPWYAMKSCINTIQMNTLYQQRVEIDTSLEATAGYDELNRYLNVEYGLNNSNYTYFVSVYEDENKNHYAWTNSKSQTLEYIFDGTRLNVSSQQYLKHKWVHFLGWSRTFAFFHKFIQTVIRYHKYSSNDYINKGHAGQKRYHGTVYYFPDIDLLVTHKRHDLNYNNASSTFNASAYFDEIVEFITNNSSIGQYWRFSIYSIPNLYIVNKGLHQAEYMESAEELYLYQKEIN
eukprot:48310_1